VLDLILNEAALANRYWETAGIIGVNKCDFII
jgi:hypothetical protein